MATLISRIARGKIWIIWHNVSSLSRPGEKKGERARVLNAETHLSSGGGRCLSLPVYVCVRAEGQMDMSACACDI